jgi:hypothetical protein
MLENRAIVVIPVPARVDMRSNALQLGTRF